MKIFGTFPTVNILQKRIFWLVICIAKKLIWTTLKLNFKVNLEKLQILSKPYINGNIIYSAFRWCWPFWKTDPYDWICAPGSRLLKTELHVFANKLFKYWFLNSSEDKILVLCHLKMNISILFWQIVISWSNWQHFYLKFGRNIISSLQN